MRSQVRIVAAPRSGTGSTSGTRGTVGTAGLVEARLVEARGEGMVAVRSTGPGLVHLIGTAAGPLGGDEVEIFVHVRAGSSLELRSVAATIALPGPDDVSGSRLALTAIVEADATLHIRLEPLIVCRGADIVCTTELDVAPTARLRVLERVVLGRHSEPGGAWHARMVADCNTMPILRHTMSSEVLEPMAARAVISELVIAPGENHWSAATAGNAVACPLGAGAVLLTAFGPDLASAEADHRAARERSATELNRLVAR